MKINKIVIVGGGSAGWMTAATLVKSFPDKEICLIESPGVPTVGVGESTIGGIRTWCRWIGIDDRPDLFFKSTFIIRFTSLFSNLITSGSTIVEKYPSNLKYCFISYKFCTSTIKSSKIGFIDSFQK